jgi:hypothetical protein
MRQHWPFAILLPLVAVTADEVFVSPSFAFAPSATVAIFIGAIIFLGFLLSAAIRESKVPAA